MKTIFLFLLGVLFSGAMNAQKDSINKLNPVILHTSILETFSDTQHVRVLGDSLIENAEPLLTDILKYQTPIYFKENGLGMVSSVSFRGTTASQTAVVWNGINVNSKFNGQTDFNSINIGGFDEISIRSGGGSVLFGSGAIGGSVHLNNTFQFEKGWQNKLKFGYGSFNSLDVRYGLSYSNEKTSVHVNAARASSDNDYPYVKSKRENLNGQYYNNNLKADFAYKFNQNNLLEIHTSVFDGERHFSLIRPSETPTKYRDFHTWNLIAWESDFDNFSSELKFAYLNEEFNYYPNTEEESHTYGKAETFLGKYGLGVNLENGMELHGLLDYSYAKGVGSSVAGNSQKIGSAAILMKQKLSERFLYEIGAKKEFTQDYKSPFLYSAGASFEVFNFYTLKLNISKNYRIPTLNDMFWEKSGNTNLKPETSHQVELGNYFRRKNVRFSITAFFIEIRDMIQWVPSTAIWEPSNVDQVQTYGVESNFDYHKKFGNHRLSFHATYSYTVSEDKETGKQLIYVPFHKATTSLGYDFKRWNLNYNFLFTGEVFTRSDNDPRDIIEKYSLSNIQITYSYPLKKGKSLNIGSKVRNLFNKNYESVENRFMPGINYKLFVIFKF